MELNHLKTFYEVARLGSFTQAARTLKISQPSISKTIKQLEEAQGVLLLERTKRRVRVTPTGAHFLQKCELIFAEIETLERSLELQKRAPTGNVRLGVSDNLANYVLPKLMKSFLKSYPQIKFEIYSGASGDIKKEIIDGHIEFGLFHTEPKESHFSSVKVGFVEFVVVCAAKSKLLANNQSVDLGKAPHIGCRVFEYTQSYPVLKMLRSLGVEPNIRVVSNSQETQLNLAAEDLGYAVVPRFMAREWIKRGRLREVPTSTPIGSTIYRAYRVNAQLSHASLLFSQYIDQHVGRYL